MGSTKIGHSLQPPLGLQLIFIDSQDVSVFCCIEGPSFLSFKSPKLAYSLTTSNPLTIESIVNLNYFVNEIQSL